MESKNKQKNISYHGFLAFFIVLFTMPLGHGAMILMEKGFGHTYIYFAATILGFLGLILLIWGILSSNNMKATFLGLFSGLLVWTGWIEFAYVYFANRFGVEPMMINGEAVTKPEYLIMPSSIGFWVVFMLYYFFGSKTGCRFFTWFQKKLKLTKIAELKATKKSTAIVTFTELILILWTFYLVLLFVYDPNFLGDRHPVTYIIAFVLLFWSAILFLRLIRIKQLAYAIKYAIPTVVIFWSFVEILGRWNFFKEIWVEPSKYWLEMTLILVVFIALIVFVFISNRQKR